VGRTSLALLVALATVAVACGGGPSSYAELRQAAEEEIPGSWGVVLKPPPDDLEPAIGPTDARAAALRIEPPGEVLETLALVPGSAVGVRDDVAAWVVMARDLCFASSKGDLVSSARRDPEDVERCSERNLWVTLVDPMTGERLASLGAYDATGSWVPATG
jgi:hypothetical protein